MSGHSKWANIKRKKEATDSKRANIFSKLGKEITVAVKMGGSPDPNVNRKLKDVIAKAKAQNMPNDNINRCIQKAAGDSSSDNYEEMVYEGFGPCGTAIIVEALTDNKNRTAADLRSIFSKSGGSLGQTGSVGYMFDKKGYILIERTSDIDEDTLMLEVLEIGAEDFVSEDEYIEIITAPENFSNVREEIEKKNLTILEADIRQIANIKKELSDEEIDKVQNFLDKLDDNDDVQNVWHNAEI
ncbi:MAG: YebC/PmpR family DNA-binding transcriptional regulator [Clostridia bacterium]|nr:YebC/PmpR family DNA-binding transcriptional regulator [Clostridia bacterium]